MKKHVTLGRMSLIGFILGAVFWLVDSTIDSFLLKTSFLRQVSSTNPEELWMRLFVLASFVGFGFYAEILIWRAENAERMSRKLSTALETAADVVVITDSRGIIEYVNPAFETVTGYTRAETAGETPRILKSGIHGEEFYKELWDTILAGEIYRNVFVNRKKNGELYYDECTITPMRDQHNVITHFIATAKVITERIMAENKLREYAEKDSLTGFLNRRKFYEVLEQEKDRVVRYGRPLSLIMFDIDHFKVVNDTYGHAVGDRVLKDTTSIVADNIRKTDSPGRIGGEEFAVLATETPPENAAELAEKIRRALEMKEFDLGRKITVSVGVSTYDDSFTVDELVRRADEALYAAKNNGRNRVECYWRLS